MPRSMGTEVRAPVYISYSFSGGRLYLRRSRRFRSGSYFPRPGHPVHSLPVYGCARWLRTPREVTRHEEYNHGDDQATAGGGFLVLVGILPGEVRTQRKRRPLRKCGAKRNVDFHATVNRPAIGIEDRPDVAL